jgi:hypothetical protein
MPTLDTLDRLFILAAFVFEGVLTVHFAVRRWRLATAIRYGPIVYLLSLPAFALSLAQMAAGKAWFFWLAGLLFLVWAAFGYIVEYVYRVEWRTPTRWSVLGPYVTLYLATTMFYWWPLARLDRRLWVAFAVLFVVATVLNISSHEDRGHAAPLSSRLRHH